jgi:hypothetical protein
LRIIFALFKENGVITMDSTNKNLLNHLWEFVNKSPIISAILISLITLIGLLLFRFYTFIYWLPYFESYNIPLNYFQLAEFDKYSLTYKLFIDTFFTYLIFYLFLKICNRVSFNNKRSNSMILIIMIMIIIISITLQSVLVRKWSMVKFFSLDIWTYISFAAFAYLIYRNIKVCNFNKKNIKLKISTIILCLFLILMGIGIATYINGYNEKVVPALVGEFKVIDENKAMLFETSDNYYIVPCVIKNDSITLYTKSYSFIEKYKVQVNTRYFNYVH